MNHHEWTFQRAAFVYRADQEAETRERMRVAGLEFADEPATGTFW